MARCGIFLIMICCFSSIFQGMEDVRKTGRSVRKRLVNKINEQQEFSESQEVDQKIAIYEAFIHRKILKAGKPMTAELKKSEMEKLLYQEDKFVPLGIHFDPDKGWRLPSYSTLIDTQDLDVPNIFKKSKK